MCVRVLIVLSLVSAIGCGPVFGEDWFWPHRQQTNGGLKVFAGSAASFGSVAKDATCLRVVLTEVTQTDDFAALEHLQNLQVLELTLPLQPVDGASQTRLLSTVRFPKSLIALSLVCGARLPGGFWNALAKAPSLVSLSVSGDAIDPADLIALESIPSLRHLKLIASSLCSEDQFKRGSVFGARGMLPCVDALRGISKCPELQQLEIHTIRIPASGILCLSALKKLTALKCSCLTDEVVPLLCDALPQLQILNVDGSQYLTDLSLPAIATLRRLKCLSLARCPSIGTLGLPAIAEIGSLERLSLEGCESPEYPRHLPELRRGAFDTGAYRIDREGLMRALATLSQVRYLSIANIPEVDDELVGCIAKSNEKMEGLDLRNCFQVTEEGVRSISKLKSLHSLAWGADISLFARKYEATSMSVECFFDLVTNGKLRSLRVHKVVGTGILPPLPDEGFQRLRELSLPGASFSDEDLARIIVSCPGLTSLDISATSAGPRTSAALSKCANLKVLNVSDCASLSQEGVRALTLELKLDRICLERTRWMSKVVLASLLKHEAWPFETLVSDYQVLRAECNEIARETRKCVFAK